MNQKEICKIIEQNPGCTYDLLMAAMHKQIDYVRRGLRPLIEQGYIIEERKMKRPTKLTRTDKPLTHHVVTHETASRYEQEIERNSRPPVPDLCHVMNRIIADSLESV